MLTTDGQKLVVPRIWTDFACYLLSLLLLTLWCRPLSAQSYEELLRENARLKERIRQLEQQLAGTTDAACKTASANHDADNHAHPEPADHLHRDPWDETPPTSYRYADPYPPDWWKPADDYRPYSWLPPPSEGFFTRFVFRPRD
jgi:hypothetical protein